MVQLPIRAGELHGDWVLIDLQGSFESNVSELKGLTMGELSFTESVLLPSSESSSTFAGTHCRVSE